MPQYTTVTIIFLILLVSWPRHPADSVPERCPLDKVEQNIMIYGEQIDYLPKLNDEADNCSARH